MKLKEAQEKIIKLCNDVALERCKDKINFEHEGADGKVYIRKGDARNLDFIPDESVDLICTHPPYADIIKYSEDIPEDLSLLKVKDFLEEMKKVASESYRVLKEDKFCAILMGDTRQKGHMIPMSFEVMRIFENAGFRLKELIIFCAHSDLTFNGFLSLLTTRKSCVNYCIHKIFTS